MRRVPRIVFPSLLDKERARMNRNSYAMGLAATLMVVAAVGCADVPTDKIDEARQALDAARTAEAATYATGEMAQAEDAAKRLDAELALQKDKFALFRSYDTAEQLAAEVRETSQAATDAATEGKEQAKDEAMAEITQARTMLAEVRAMMANAPRGKGTALDLAALNSDLTAAEAALNEVDASFGSGRYLDAETGASAARESIEKVREAVTAAVQAKQSAARRRG